MVARIVDVTGFDLVTGHMADAEVRASASLSASATRSQSADATRSITATITASATVATVTDLTSSLVNGVGTYTAATLPIPAWDASYTVTVSSTTLSTTTPAVLVVLFPTPSTPLVDHEMAVAYTIGASRTWKIVHPLPGYSSSADFLPTGGVYFEPGGAPGDYTLVTYRWSAAEQAVVVESATGDVLTLDHSPDNVATAGFPVLFTPETQALGSFSTIEAKHLRAVAAIPSATRTLFADVNVVGEVFTAQEFYETLGFRVHSNPSLGTGAKGLTTDGRGVVASYEEEWDIEGSVFIHELGHAMSVNYLTEAGHPSGIEPYMPASGPGVIYWPGTSNVRYDFTSVYGHTGTGYRISSYVTEYNSSGGFVQEFEYHSTTAHDPWVEAEADVVTLFRIVENAGSYYVSQADEFTAQSFARYWAGLNGSNSGAALDLMDSTLGSETVHAHFVDYIKSIGAAPGSPSDSTPPGPVAGLTGVAGLWEGTGLVTVPKVTLSWTNPAASDLASIRVRRAVGSTPPTSVTSGERVVVGGPWVTVVDPNVSAGTTYSYAVFARDFAGNTSTAATVTVAVP